jgi:hypothetical protein
VADGTSSTALVPLPRSEATTIALTVVVDLRNEHGENAIRVEHAHDVVELHSLHQLPTRPGNGAGPGDAAPPPRRAGAQRTTDGRPRRVSGGGREWNRIMDYNIDKNRPVFVKTNKIGLLLHRKPVI